MKKLIAVLALLFATSALAHSGAYVTYTNSGTFVSGAAYDSGVIDTRDLESLVVVADADTADRALVVNCLANDQSTVLFAFPTVTAAVAGQDKVVISLRPDSIVPGTAPTGVTYYNVNLCRYMSVTAASAAGAGTIQITGRRNQVGASVVTSYYESGSVTAGAALATPVFDLRRAQSVTFLVEATTTNRALIVSCTNAAGTVLFSYASLTVTAGSKYLRNYRPDSPTPGSEPTGVVHFPVELCPYMKATVAAAGAASAKLSAYVRN